ncbi:hypothetical protein ALO95_200264 [Pseudomonas syringae pv. antirrhini]|uniref:hypothetical protein n=1 Tax=Pseudomonas syringae group genomosp. 3 TaxID=251701 RepID=UPI000EFA6E90|nr:hypothetical protein [Pseudomonas syringae group genomosp. 3]RMP44309.1 hypothetical protein ALQ23_200294 [Pseudomonas syringae pv. antirrhini]RMW26001.1 hypothetical protein ALO95_200264 [Pseudomonas syringae pv. antirrhini]
MTTDITNERSIFGAFHADPRFQELRSIRSQLQPIVAVLRSNVLNFRQGTRELTPKSAQFLRENVLHMMQIENAMVEACANLPIEYAPVKARILADFDTEQSKEYLAKVNDWLRLIEGNA